MPTAISVNTHASNASASKPEQEDAYGSAVVLRDRNRVAHMRESNFYISFSTFATCIQNEGPSVSKKVTFDPEKTHMIIFEQHR